MVLRDKSLHSNSPSEELKCRNAKPFEADAASCADSLGGLRASFLPDAGSRCLTTGDQTTRDISRRNGSGGQHHGIEVSNDSNVTINRLCQKEKR